VTAALQRPNGILLKAKVPKGHVKVILSWSSSAIEIWVQAEYPSKKH